MRTPRLYLSVCALVLAVTGAFATKISNQISPTTIWYEDTVGSCVSTVIEIEPCAHIGAIDCMIALPGGNETVYQTTDENGDCISPYKRFAL